MKKFKLKKSTRLLIRNSMILSTGHFVWIFYSVEDSVRDSVRISAVDSLKDSVWDDLRKKFKKKNK